MSARFLRRVLKEKEQQLRPLSDLDPELDAAADDDDDDDEEPDAPAPYKNPFDILDEQDEEEEDEEVVDGGNVGSVTVKDTVVKNPSVQVSNRKSKKNKKKNKEKSASAKYKAENLLDLKLGDSSTSANTTSDFENVKAPSSEVPVSTKNQGTPSVLQVDPKYLKAENELRKIFGAKVVNSFENRSGAGSSRQMYAGRRAAHNPRKTILITPSNHWPRWDGSMSMELLETKNGQHYFRYVLCPSYSHAQEAFEAAKAINDLNAIASILANYPYHIDSLLTFAEVFKFSGEHHSSADIIGKCLYALECAWHPLFSPLQANCQLKYNHDTNKPTFTALFSHMKNLDKRGCHRSALEVCKLLLSLDSDDPKGALFCIDYFALRAMEYKWLEQLSEEYRSDNSIWLFPNFAYSLAVCRFYLERDTTEANMQSDKAAPRDLMKQALLLHPLVLQKVVAKAPLKESVWSEILKSPLFGSAKAGSPTLDHLISIYVERSYLIWRFPELQSLLKGAALEVIEALKQNSSEATDWACIRKEAFSSENNEYSHLLVSDFSDVVPSLPPEELRHLMVGPQMVPEIHNGGAGAAVPARPPREVAGRNGFVVLLESLAPWVVYEDNRNGHPDGHEQNND